MNIKSLNDLKEMMPTEESYHKVLVSYLETADALIKDIELAIEVNDTEKLKLAAHSLKSSSAQIGAEEVSQISKQLEVQGREGYFSGVAALLKELQEEYAKSRVIIEGELLS